MIEKVEESRTKEQETGVSGCSSLQIPSEAISHVVSIEAAEGSGSIGRGAAVFGCMSLPILIGATSSVVAVVAVEESDTTEQGSGGRIEGELVHNPLASFFRLHPAFFT